MNSLTDSEIIKAKAHFEYGIKCDIFQEPVLSYAKTVLEAFDELSRQKAEIENYIKVAEYQQNLTLKKSFEIKELKAEIERLQKENNQFADIGKMYSEIKAEAKAEARKEVIERLNKEMGWWEEPDGYYTRFISDGELADIIRKMENDTD